MFMITEFYTKGCVLLGIATQKEDGLWCLVKDDYGQARYTKVASLAAAEEFFHAMDIAMTAAYS